MNLKYAEMPTVEIGSYRATMFPFFCYFHIKNKNPFSQFKCGVGNSKMVNSDKSLFLASIFQSLLILLGKPITYNSQSSFIHKVVAIAALRQSCSCDF